MAMIEAKDVKKQIGRFRVLIIGRANAGKTTILQRVCNTTKKPQVYDSNGNKLKRGILKSSYERGNHDITNQLVFKSNPGFIFHVSYGFEAGNIEEFEDMKKFISERANSTQLKDRIHAIWYCISMGDHNRTFQRSEEMFFSECDTGNVPVIAVFTKFDSLDVIAFTKIKKGLNGLSAQETWARISERVEGVFADTKVWDRLCDTAHRTNPKCYVRLANMHERKANCDALLESTTAVLHDEEMQRYLVSTQQANLNICIEYAVPNFVHLITEEDGVPWDSLLYALATWFPNIKLDVGTLMVHDPRAMLKAQIDKGLFDSKKAIEDLALSSVLKPLRGAGNGDLNVKSKNERIRTGIAVILVLEYSMILGRKSTNTADSIASAVKYYMKSPVAFYVAKVAEDFTALALENNEEKLCAEITEFIVENRLSMDLQKIVSHVEQQLDVLQPATEFPHTSKIVRSTESVIPSNELPVQTDTSGIGFPFDTISPENDTREIESVDLQLYYDEGMEQSGSVRVLRPRKSDLSTYSYHYWGPEAYATCSPPGADGRICSQPKISIGAQATFNQCHINIFNVQSNDNSAVSDVTSNVGGISCARAREGIHIYGVSPPHPDSEQGSSSATTQSPVETHLGEGVIQDAIFAELAKMPLRLFNTHTGLLCNREAQVRAFEVSEAYKELVSSITALPESERIKKTVKDYFQSVMLSHRWEGREPQLPDIQDKNIFKLDTGHNIIKLQKFCETARQRGYRWAWSDTCCIDKKNNVEVQKSLITMFLWYRNAALTITYLSDVSGSSTSGGLAGSAWRTRGWILQEFLASPVILFFRKDWSLYGDESSNHKEAGAILGEVEEATGIDQHALAKFQAGSDDVRLKLRWASTRVTTEEEDVAYSLLGIFKVKLQVMYGEGKEEALGRLLQKIITQSGDVTILDWIGKASVFNNCLPEDISTFERLPFAPPTLSREERDEITSALRAAVSFDAVTQLYNQLHDLPRPRFVSGRLTLPCIVYPVSVQRREREGGALCFSYEITANGLKDICITTSDDLTPSRSPRPRYLLVRPWSHAFFTEDSESKEEDSFPNPNFDANSIDNAEAEHRAALRLLVRLGQPFSALILVQLGAEYKRIACDCQIIAQFSDSSSMPNSNDIRTLDIL